MDLLDLGKTLSNLTDDELRLLVQDIRQSRRATRNPAKGKAKTSKQVSSLDSIMSSLSPDMLQQIINTLEGQR
jgi:hypothetical protein